MIDQFLTYLEVERRYSPNTITSYKKDLGDFLVFYQMTEGDNDISKADKKVVRNYIVYLSQQDLHKRSINRKLSSLRSYFLFMLRLGMLEHSPMDGIQSLKFYPEKQIPISEEEGETLSEVLLKEDVGELERVIVEILYQTGIRKAELCALKLDSIDFSKNELRIWGKGNKVRIVPISENLAQSIQDYLKIRQPQDAEDDTLLINSKGKKVGPKFVYNVVNKYLSKVTTKVKKSPHILRHSFATHVLNNGAEISKVQKIMGHSSLVSTQVYTNANIHELKKAFNGAHPRARHNEGGE